MSKQYTLKEVQESCAQDRKNLLVIHDNVYDVTVFLNEHPGGEEVLLDHKGKDASEDFDDVGHSNDAIGLMSKYRVGQLVEHERTNKKPKAGWVAGYDDDHAKKSVVSSPGMPLYLLIGAVVVLNLGLWLYFY